MTPLYGHSSKETAKVVEDYPYGRLRCTIFFWLEMNHKKGFRFVSQTINPKNGRVNAEKKSTYCDFAGNLYLDEQGHTQWTGIGIYSSAEQVLEFIQNFPGSDFSLLKPWVKNKTAFQKLYAADKVGFTIGGVKQEVSEYEFEQRAKELAVWEQAKALLDMK